MNANILVETEGLSREKWLRYRKQGIGGSDVAAILGISKWNSAISLWLNKTNQTEDDTQENEAMEWGTIMEPVIRNHFAIVWCKKEAEEKVYIRFLLEYWKTIIQVMKLKN